MKKNYCLITMIGIAGALSSVNAFADYASDIQTDASGTAITYDDASGSFPVISSVLSAPSTLDGYTYTSWAFLAQDVTGGLDVFAKSSTLAGLGYTPAAGQAISINATYSPFDGIPELATPTSVTLASTGNATGTTVVTIPQVANGTAAGNGTYITPSAPALGITYAGEYLELDNVTIGSGVAYGGNALTFAFPTHANDTLSVSDGANSMVMYFWASSYSTTASYGGTPIPTGAVDMDGFVDYFLNTSAGTIETEFVPTSITALTPLPTPEPSILNLCGAGSALAYVVSRFRKKA